MLRLALNHDHCIRQRQQRMSSLNFKLATLTAMDATPSPTLPDAEEVEYYSSWSLFLVCMLLILSLWTSYYLQIKRIRAVHETVVSIFAGMFVGLIVRLAPGTMIRDMLVSGPTPVSGRSPVDCTCLIFDRRSNILSSSTCYFHQ